MRRKCYWTYILASKRNGTLYVGVTSDLPGRTWEHREGVVPGFTKKYGVKMLVYFETFDDINVAIDREKRLKFYRRHWKLRLIESVNPEWRGFIRDTFRVVSMPLLVLSVMLRAGAAPSTDLATVTGPCA